MYVTLKLLVPMCYCVWTELTLPNENLDGERFESVWVRSDGGHFRLCTWRTGDIGVFFKMTYEHLAQSFASWSKSDQRDKFTPVCASIWCFALCVATHNFVIKWTLGQTMTLMFGCLFEACVQTNCTQTPDYEFRIKLQGFTSGLVVGRCYFVHKMCTHIVTLWLQGVGTKIIGMYSQTKYGYNIGLQYP